MPVTVPPRLPADREEERHQMVEWQLVRRGISDPRVLDAFRTVPREAFVPPELAEFAYRDAPLPIAQQQTISQPYIVAVTTAALGLAGHERVLEIGTGSGYAAAILGCLAKDVVTIERHAALADQSRARLETLGLRNVEVLHGDGTLGWPERAPYDAIAVAAGGPQVPRALLDQLAPGGRLVIPVGPEHAQVLTRVTRTESGAFREERAIGVVYRPDTEVASHYFQARLPEQFDEYVWFDETEAVRPLSGDRPRQGDLPETYPFGL